MRTTMLISAAAALGAALIAGAPNGSAEVLPLPSHEDSVAMADGWQLRVGHRDEVTDRVLPLNGIGTTREVFATNQAYGSIGGSGTALQGVVLRTGYHVGCAVDLKTVTLGASVTAGFTPGIQINPSIPTPTVGATLGPTASVAPKFDVTLQPGKIVDLPTGEKPLEGTRAFITTRNAHVHVDGCLGPASIRSYTIIAAKSAEVDDSVAVYGDPVAI
ncbi:MspA family porin [Nocardia blacklockiae]|uniref:MspA family porin n=1 Tax=Nocardia blacklockiae TaxID=480036 RepID=UPI0018961B23|nr:MspA family porin [Nocardia blacklockiae]MBF6171643.1 MspA family porin [Nocardia blacklockiae]